MGYLVTMLSTNSLLSSRLVSYISPCYVLNLLILIISAVPELEQKCIDGLKCPTKDKHTGQAYDLTIGEAVRDAKGNRVCFHNAGDFIKQAAAYLRQNRGSPPDVNNAKEGPLLRDNNWGEKAQQRDDTRTSTGTGQAPLGPSGRDSENDSVDSQSEVDTGLVPNEPSKEGSTITSVDVSGRSDRFGGCNHLYQDVYLFDSIENVDKLLVCETCGNRSQMVKYCCKFCGLNVCSSCEANKIAKPATMGQTVVSEENTRMNTDAMAENARRATRELLRGPLDSPKDEEPQTIDRQTSVKGLPNAQYQFKIIHRPLAEQTRLTRIANRLEVAKDKTEFWMPALPWRCLEYVLTTIFSPTRTNILAAAISITKRKKRVCTEFPGRRTP